MRCAVSKCKQSNSGKTTGGKYISFYSFPKDAALRKTWVKFCNRRNTINVLNEKICGLHFNQENFERNLKFEMGFSKWRGLKLKAGSVPTIHTTDTASDVDKITCVDKSIPMTTGINKESLQPLLETVKVTSQAGRNSKTTSGNAKTETPTFLVFKQLSCLNNTENSSPNKKIFLINLRDFRNSYDREKISSSNVNTTVCSPTESFLKNQVSFQQEPDSFNKVLPNTDIKIEEIEENTDLDTPHIEYETEHIVIKPDIYQQSHSDSNCFQALSSIENKQTTIKDELLRLPFENYKQKQETYQTLCSLWSQKLTKLCTSQRIFAEKIINDVLFNGELGLLSFNTSLTNLSPYQSVPIIKKENVE